MEFFTSDLHIGHENIIKFDQRPFENIWQMEKEIICRINERVTNSDILYIVGDLAFKVRNVRHIENFIKRLNCNTIILILGNHDEFNPFKYVDIGIQSVHTSLFINNQEFCLIHDPSVCSGFRQQKFICGHVHKLFTKLDNVVNVGCCVHNYYPISLDEIRTIIEEPNG